MKATMTEEIMGLVDALIRRYDKGSFIEYRDARAAVLARIERLVAIEAERDAAMIDVARLVAIVNILRASHVSARATIREMPSPERDALMVLLRRRAALSAVDGGE